MRRLCRRPTQPPPPAAVKVKVKSQPSIKPSHPVLIRPGFVGAIKIIVVGCNCDKYIKKCLTSIVNQTEKNWQCCVVLDPSVDKTYNVAKQFVDDKIQIHLNTKQQYATKNSLDAVQYMNPEDDNDVIIWVDADDWLYRDESLSIVKTYYERYPNSLITHGSWVGFPDPTIKTNNQPYQPEDFDYIRDLSIGNWRGSHLRTMKYCVFKNIETKYLKDKRGNWLKSSYDTSFMYPALEMAGYERTQFIPEILYTYNRETPFNDDKVNANWQDECALYNSTLPSYYLL